MELLKRLAFAPIIAYSFAIVAISHQVLPDKLLPFEHADKVAHFVEYLLYVELLYLALAINRPAAATNRLWAAGFSIAFGISDEIHQYFVPGRSCSIVDLLVDCMGIGFGLYAVRRLPMFPDVKQVKSSQHEGENA